jgi:hypothetical protein
MSGAPRKGRRRGDEGRTRAAPLRLQPLRFHPFPVCVLVPLWCNVRRGPRRPTSVSVRGPPSVFCTALDPCPRRSRPVVHGLKGYGASVSNIRYRSPRERWLRSCVIESGNRAENPPNYSPNSQPDCLPSCSGDCCPNCLPYGCPGKLLDGLLNRCPSSLPGCSPGSQASSLPGSLPDSRPRSFPCSPPDGAEDSLPNRLSGNSPHTSLNSRGNGIGEILQR